MADDPRRCPYCFNAVSVPANCAFCSLAVELAAAEARATDQEGELAEAGRIVARLRARLDERTAERDAAVARANTLAGSVEESVQAYRLGRIMHYAMIEEIEAALGEARDD